MSFIAGAPAHHIHVISWREKSLIRLSTIGSITNTYIPSDDVQIMVHKLVDQLNRPQIRQPAGLKRRPIPEALLVGRHSTLWCVYANPFLLSKSCRACDMLTRSQPIPLAAALVREPRIPRLSFFVPIST